jgi:hypothetical protein
LADLDSGVSAVAVLTHMDDAFLKAAFGTNASLFHITASNERTARADFMI